MKKLLIAAALVGAGSLLFQDVSTGHGGTYRGPGDTVPPGGGGGGGGGGPSGPGLGGPGGPAGPGGPSTPGPSGPATPGVGPAAGGSGPVTGGATEATADLTLWHYWWEFNKDPYLNLKDAIFSGSTETGTEEFFLGHGEKSEARDSLRPDETQIRQTIVPALKSALKNETNNDIVTGAMIALAKIGDEKSESGESEFEGIIKPFLKDSNQEIRETAALALGILANPDSIATLVHLMHDTPTGRDAMGKTQVDYRTQAFAAYGLALVGHASQPAERALVFDALVYAADNDTTATRDVAVACLLAMGLVPVDTIEAIPAEEGSDTVSAPSSSRSAQIDYLLAYFQDESNNFMTRAHAPTSVARLMRGLDAAQTDAFKARVAPIFLDAIGRRSKAEKEIQQSCVLALGEMCDSDKDPLDIEIRKALMAVPEEISDAQTRHFSMIALGQAAGRPGSGPDPGSGSAELQKELLKTMAKGKSSLRTWSAMGVGVWGNTLLENEQTLPNEVVQALRSSMIEEKNPDRFGAYAIACGMVQDTDAQENLLKKLDQLKTNEARGYACVALGMMGSRSSIEHISKIVKESQYRPDLLRQAAVALGLLGDKDTVDEMIDMLKGAKGLATQAALSSALGFIGDRRSVDPLVEMLENKQLTATARGFAAVALGIVADKEPLPWNSKISFGVNYRASTHTLNDPEGTGVLNIL